MNLNDLFPSADILYEALHQKHTTEDIKATTARLKPLFEAGARCIRTCGSCTGNDAIELALWKSNLAALDSAIQWVTRNRD